MVTDRYLKISHHPSVTAFADAVTADRHVIIGVDNLEGAIPLEAYELPHRTCLVFGSEGPGLTDELVTVCQDLVAITQYGSTRSLNAGAAAAIAMYHWALRWGR
jgi:tRNA G18 (ribose-2'-O)-methylase SpoU